MDFDDYNQTNSIYEAHSEREFYADLFLPNLLKVLLALPGLICNPALVYVTYMQKSLHGSCNILLAVGAFFDFLYLFGYCLPLLLTATGVNFIPLQTCFFIAVIPLASLFSSVSSVFFIGFDRLLNVLLPFHYNLINQPLYLAIVFTLILAYSIYAIGLAVPGVWAHPQWATQCAQSDMYRFLVDSPLSQNGLYINGASFCCYILVWFLIWKLRNNSSSAVSMHGGGGPNTSNSTDVQRGRIFKSVLMIMFFVVGVWLFNVVYSTLLAKYLLTDPFSTNYIAPAVSLLTVIIASTTNPPILYACSKEYRRAFQRLLCRFPLLKCCFKKLFKDANSTLFMTTVKHKNNNNNNQQHNSVHPIPITMVQQRNI